MDGRTRIELCGRLRVEWEGARVEDDLRGRQGRLLFAYLVLHRARPVRRDELVAAVWPADPPPGTEAQLATLLSRLRRVVGADRLAGRAELQLALPEGATVDWEDVRVDVDRARAALGAGDGAAALEAAEAAVAVADGELLPGLEAPWVEVRRAELAELRVEALELAADAGALLGGPALVAAERTGRAAVEAAPFRESARRALMGVLRARGDVAGALAVFEDVRVLLEEELGTRPGPVLVALHTALLGQEQAAAAAPPPPAAIAEAPPGAPRADPAPADLVEREREVELLARLLADAMAGEGRIALLEGPAGVGKTRLLAEARRRGTAAGARVLSARAGELERGFPFGVVRQLLEGELADPARRGRLLAGAAAPAAVVFDELGAPVAGEGAADASFAVLHGLFWLTVNLTADGPLVLAVDDLPWCDRPSLRFLAYLVRRLEGLPVLLATTVRTGEPPTDAALLEEVVHDPAATSVRPGPLSAAAARRLVEARLGPGADPAFVEACRDTTGGNPLLLGQLLTALRAEGVPPGAERVERVRELGPRAVSRTIALRLARMSPETVAVARAVAVLGESAQLPTVAALAELDVPAAAQAVGALARAEVLRAEPPLGFVHPLVRDAVYHELPVGRRELRHGAAARVLAAAGAGDEQVAVHLVKAPPAGDAWAAAVLQRAGSAAARRGAADSAVTLLRRALAEPPPEHRRAELLLELGASEKLVDGGAAVEHLTAAYAALAEPQARGAAALALVETLFFAAPPAEALAFTGRAIPQTPPELASVRLGLEAYRMFCQISGSLELDELLARLAAYEADGLPGGEGEHERIGTRMLEAVVAFGWAVTGRPAEQCAEVALRSLRGGDLARVDDGLMIPGPIITLTLADRPEAPAAIDAVLGEAHRRGSLLLTLTAHMWRGHALIARGEPAEAERALRESLAELVLWGSGEGVAVYAQSLLVGALVDRGDLAAANAAFAAALLSPAPPGGQGQRQRLMAEIELRLAQARPDEALAAAERLRAATGEAGAHSPFAPVHALRARCLTAVGRGEEAVPVAEAALAVAQRWGAPASVGHALRVLGEALGGEAGRARLAEAVGVLTASHARLERARALAALAAAHLAAGDAEAAAGARDDALALALACGAQRLVADLRAAGATEPAAAVLTDGERRAVALAGADGGARAVAEALHLTPHEAEGLLAGARGKLGRDPSPAAA